MSNINKAFVEKITKEYAQSTNEKNKCQQFADQGLHISKRVIFSVQRGEISQAKKLFLQATTLIKKLMIHEKHTHKGPVSAALEEFVESYIVLLIAQNKEINAHPDMHIPADIYIGSLSDALGEIVRMATHASIQKNIAELNRLHKIAQEIMTVLMHMDITGNVRQKFDQAKAHIRHLEHIMYEMSLRNEMI